MRLPTLTPGQQQHEDSRAFHEAVWRASEHGRRVSFPTTPAQVRSREAWRKQGAAHKFWSQRGYFLRTAVTADQTAIEYWVEPRTRATVKTNLEPVRVDPAWRQRSVS